jgi:hypothetical protein
MSATTIYCDTPRVRDAPRRSLPDWRDLIHLPEAELAEHDIAAINLACAAGLPGAEEIDAERCLNWLDTATDCVRRWTDAAIDEFFHANPAEYNNSEACFRVLAMTVALQRHCGVKFDPAKIGAGPEVPFELHEEFIHGVVQGPGGTCANLPVVYASIGRRLGYPIRLVCTKRHMCARWDDGKGERFNIECAGEGFADFADDHYRKWPLVIENTEEERVYGYLENFTPRRELAEFIGRRGFVFKDHRRFREAAENFCIAAELTPKYATYHKCIMATLVEWKKHFQSLYPPRFPRQIDVLLRPDLRRWKTIPWPVEREIAALRVTEHALNDPIANADWWEPLRNNRPPLRPVPTKITADYNQLFPASPRS